jgi:hypothetical protein
MLRDVIVGGAELRDRDVFAVNMEGQALRALAAFQVMLGWFPASQSFALHAFLVTTRAKFHVKTFLKTSVMRSAKASSVND